MENYILATCTDKGKVRSVNEDSMATFDSPNGRVLLVCDGMGGQNAGDVASQLVVTVIQDILSDNTFSTPEEAITRSIIAANQAVLRRASQDENLSGMGSTCVMAIVKDGKIYYGSVGDSRIYYISNGVIRQMTKDQSYVQTLVDEGTITQEAAEHHQDKNQITNALGIEEMTPPVVSQTPIVPEPGSILLLCSDGLSGMINNNTILTTLSNRQIPLNDRARQLVNLANSAGGLDNVTVQLMEFPMGTGATNAAYPSDSASCTCCMGRKKNPTNSLLILIICLLLVAIIGGGVYWYFVKTNPKPDPNPIPKPVDTTLVKEEKKESTPTEEKKEDTTKINTPEQKQQNETPKTGKTKNKRSKSLPGVDEIGKQKELSDKVTESDGNETSPEEMKMRVRKENTIKDY